MKHFAKWTFLLVMAALIGFSATVLVTQSTRLASLLPSEQANPLTETTLDTLPDVLVAESGIGSDEGASLVAGESALADDATLAVNAPESVVAEPAVAVAPGGFVQTGGATEVSSVAMAQMQTGAPATTTEQAPTSQTVGGLLNAVGTIEVAHGRQVVLATNGQVQEIAVEVGDSVQAGDLLLALDTTFLDWSLEQAEISFETERIRFEELGETVRESDVAVAEANLLLAQENAVQARQGPTSEELGAAQAGAAAAWARYEELQEQPTQAQINQALANLRRAEITVEGAQREYDRIAWLPEASATSAADALQRATIDLEAARAAFEEVNRPARDSELQGALSSAQSAQATLNNLRLRPTAAEIADAEARLAAAEAAYEQALLGPRASDMRIGELSMRQAMINLEQARLALENAQVVAPIDGTVLSVNVELGQQASSGSVVATLADPQDVRLVVNVEQRDIRFVSIGQGVEISIYALPDATFLGVVNKIAPIAGSGTGFVTFPVIIEIIDGPLDRVLPGMTASAAFLGGVAPDAEDAVEIETPEADEIPVPEQDDPEDAELDAADADAADADDATEADETGDDSDTDVEDDTGADADSDTDTDADADDDSQEDSD